ncbi:hypothetical protein [Spirosoma foliorum]|uniref:Uncharacterized protein n=1 Tax=Spirosoma foliorum TaxID=2710596 RepID=A0A7G5GUD7_9BACT|nr:hypothetical protein [Spirosoma foliorum]QMW02479.1 hypothetical protein H3H32_31985 [Spirosoma foliorum]
MNSNSDLINPEFAQNAALQLELLKEIDQVLNTTDEERWHTMDLVLQNHIRYYEANEITQDELQFATNLWLDGYPLRAEAEHYQG